MAAALHTQVFQNADAFEQLRPAWNDLLSRSALNLIFLTWEWQSTWWRVYGEQSTHALWMVGVYAGEQLVGLAPWFIQDREGERVVRTVGCVDVTDYVDVIAEGERADEVQQVLAQFLFEHHDAYDRVNLCNIPEQSPTCQTMPDLLRDLGFDAGLVCQEVCPVIHLPDEFEGYLDMLDKKQRHEIRRKMRKAENEAELQYLLVGAEHTDADWAEWTDTYLRLMAASQPSKAEFLADARNEQFMRAIIDVTRAQGWLRLSFLLLDGRAAAAYCDFDYHRQLLVYNSGLLPDYLPHLSSGIVLLAYNIRQAIETGHQVYDFLRGNETYKYRMGAQDTRVFKLVARIRQPELV